MVKRQVLYRDIMPNFRVNGGMVEIPHEFDHMFGPIPPKDVARIKELVVPVIREMTRAHKPALIYDESSGNHRAHVWGTRVPIGAFNSIGERPVPGWHVEE